MSPCAADAAQKHTGYLVGCTSPIGTRKTMRLAAAADGHGVVAALMLGASAAMIGTAFLRAPEARTHAWADALADPWTEEAPILAGLGAALGRGTVAMEPETGPARGRGAGRAFVGWGLRWSPSRRGAR